MSGRSTPPVCLCFNHYVIIRFSVASLLISANSTPFLNEYVNEMTLAFANVLKRHWRPELTMDRKALAHTLFCVEIRNPGVHNYTRYTPPCPCFFPAPQNQILFRMFLLLVYRKRLHDHRGPFLNGEVSFFQQVSIRF